MARQTRRRSPWPLLVALASCAHPSAPAPAPVAAAAVPAPAAEAPPAPVAGPDADAKAEAAFLALEPRFDELDAMRFDEPARLKAAMKARVMGQRKLEHAYEAILHFGSPRWTVAALVRLGDLGEGLGQLLREAAAPAGLTPEQAGLYRKQLLALARPAEERAIAAYQRAIDLEAQAGQPSQWGASAREQLAQLKAREP